MKNWADDSSIKTIRKKRGDMNGTGIKTICPDEIINEKSSPVGKWVLIILLAIFFAGFVLGFGLGMTVVNLLGMK